MHKITIIYIDYYVFPYYVIIIYYKNCMLKYWSLLKHLALQSTRYNEVESVVDVYNNMTKLKNFKTNTVNY